LDVRRDDRRNNDMFGMRTSARVRAIIDVRDWGSNFHTRVQQISHCVIDAPI
jgi:hypothetical protein